MTEAEKRSNVINLAFGGDESKFQAFCEHVRKGLPEGTGVVLRGSAVTGQRWGDGAPFDADGPGTSDLDLTVIGAEVLGLFKVTGFYVPGVHTRPLGEEDPLIAPDLVPLRQQLTAMVGRPVNIQATRDFVMQFRESWFGQPYLTMIGQIGGDREDEADDEGNTGDRAADATA
jgi:hypothetical protein